MKDKEQLYAHWLSQRRQITVPESFTKNVMGAVEQASTRKRERINVASLPERLQHPFYQWLTASGLVLLGVFRILYVAGTLFRTNLVMP